MVGLLNSRTISALIVTSRSLPLLSKRLGHFCRALHVKWSVQPCMNLLFSCLSFLVLSALYLLGSGFVTTPRYEVCCIARLGQPSYTLCCTRFGSNPGFFLGAFLLHPNFLATDSFCLPMANLLQALSGVVCPTPACSAFDSFSLCVSGPIIGLLLSSFPTASPFFFFLFVVDREGNPVACPGQLCHNISRSICSESVMFDFPLEYFWMIFESPSLLALFLFSFLFLLRM